MSNKTTFLSFKTLLFTVILIVTFFQCSDEEEVINKIEAPPAKKENPPSPPPAATSGIRDCSACTYVVPPNTHKIDGKALGIKPGDVIGLNAELKYSNLAFDNIIGTADNPVLITNCGGTVIIDTPGKPYVIRFTNSKFMRFTGGDTDNTYGIKLTGSTSSGLAMGYLSTNFEVDHIEVYDIGFAGIMAKTDPSCDDASLRGNYTMRHVSFHHNYIHDTHGEGFYIGHSSYMGKETACGFRMPHLIEGVKLYNNIVKNSGWDAIQVSSAPKGVKIFNNIIENYSTAKKPAQSSGICIGGGTGGECYGNLINGGFGPGITVFGIGDNIIHNNIIVNAGSVGIFCDERTPPGPGYRFINNTIISPNQEGLRIYADQVVTSVVANNIIANPGSTATDERAYVSKLNTSVTLDMSNNYFTKNISDLKFINPQAHNFKLTNTSPVIDKGRDISKYNIEKCFYETDRLKGKAYDIGASEY